MNGSGATIKCKQCFARFHADCQRLHNDNNPINDNTIDTNALCPMCIGNASEQIISNYQNLQGSIEEEKKLLRDWSENECIACGDVGSLICCDLCFCEEPLHKIDSAGQFHLECAMTSNVEPFICPLCTLQIGSTRLESLHFFNIHRQKQRVHRMQQKALKAQEFVKQIGFEIDEIKKCVFCRIESDDTAQGVFFDEENEFVGPFKLDGIKYWAHYQCVMWAPQVYMNEKNQFVDVQKEIKRSRQLTCSVCHKHGAVLGCYEKGCYATYHYKCALADHCYFDNEYYAIYCPQHYFEHFLADECKNKLCVNAWSCIMATKKKKEQKNMQTLMSINGQKRTRKVFEGGVQNNEIISPHEAKRRRVFNLEPMDLSNFGDQSQEVGGCENAKKILKELVLLPLLYPKLFASFKLKPAKGVILYGPPGTGKTLLARSLIAMSKTKQISFFSRRGPDILSKFHGESERNLRSLFLRAQQCAPSIIFFDEIDGLCPIRSYKHDQVHNSVVATLLSLMDGLTQNEKVFVIAATNRIDYLDNALRRPGRFDREIYVGLPSQNERFKILKIHTSKWNVSECDNEFEEYLKYIAKNKCNGFSGAALASFCNESFLNCLYRNYPGLLDGECVDLRSENVKICIDDFEKTFRDGFKCSNNGFCGFDIDNLNNEHRRVFDDLMERMNVFITCHKEGTNMPKYNDRILICDKNGNENENNHKMSKLFVGYLLHKLDIMNVHYLSIPMIAANVSIKEVFSNILSKIKQAILSEIGVLVIYDLDIWLDAYPQIIETVLLSTINDLCRDRNTLLLVTCNQEWNATNCWKNEWKQTVYKYFSNHRHHFTI